MLGVVCFYYVVFLFLVCLFCLFNCLFFAFLQVSLRTFADLATPVYVRFCPCFLFIGLLRTMKPNCVHCGCHRWRYLCVYPSDSHILFLPVCAVLSCPVSAHNGYPWTYLSPFRVPTLNNTQMHPSALMNTHHDHPRTPATRYLMVCCVAGFYIVLLGGR